MSPAVFELVKLVRGEYLDVPGLDLSRGQLQALWNLDAPTCEHVIGSLVDSRFLSRTPAGTYVRAPQPAA